MRPPGTPFRPGLSTRPCSPPAIGWMTLEERRRFEASIHPPFGPRSVSKMHKTRQPEPATVRHSSDEKEQENSKTQFFHGKLTSSLVLQENRRLRGIRAPPRVQ